MRYRSVIVIYDTKDQKERLYALNTSFEFEMYDKNSHEYVNRLVTRCKERGHPDANWFVPTGTLEGWLHCCEAQSFLRKWETKYAGLQTN